MKNFILIMGVIAFLIAVYSCEENFSPKIEHNEKYILYCLMNIDSPKQTAVLLKSYDVPGYDPYANTESSFVTGADIVLRQKDRVFFMKDTTSVEYTISRYTTPISFYYLDNFQSSGNDSIQIVVFLPNGKKLYGMAKAPETVEFDASSDKLLPPEEGDLFSFIWRAPTSTRWYLPRLTFFYIKDGVTLNKEVPVYYKLSQGTWTPVYPTITNLNFVKFSVAALDSCFLEISREDPDKSSYKILGAALTLLVFDENLSNYYSTTNGFLDDYTLILDEIDYTNIEGGLGIFGIYRQQATGALFDEEYIKSFGYTPGLK